MERRGRSAPVPQALTRAHDAADHIGVAARYFTAETARAALEEVRPLAEAMVAHRRALADAQRRRAALLRHVAGNGGDIQPSELGEVSSAVEREAAAVARCVEKIHARGAQVKDLDRGLVDFPALREGEEILLSWHVGESDIAYWHRSDEGFAGRKPL